MHMADALISPAVGCCMWAVSIGTLAYSSKKVSREINEKQVPLMGVLGAFIFAAQMINFTIPATGSSGHLGGGLLLSILLGPSAAFLVISSVLTVQALFFADGGLLALGCNIFNLGAVPAFVAYPLMYSKIAGRQPSRAKLTFASIVSAVFALQLGSLGVVLETCVSGVSSIPFSTFISLMQPIHLGIGAVEGLVTACVVSFIYQARPEIIRGPLKSNNTPSVVSLRMVTIIIFTVAVLLGGVFSWYSSEQPDGLEWSLQKITGNEVPRFSKDGVHGILATLQEKTVFLPDYNFPKTAANHGSEAENRPGTTISGILGSFVSIAMVGFIGYILNRRTQNN